MHGYFSIGINHFWKILVELGCLHILFCIAKQEKVVSRSSSGTNTAWDNHMKMTI